MADESKELKSISDALKNLSTKELAKVADEIKKIGKYSEETGKSIKTSFDNALKGAADMSTEVKDVQGHLNGATDEMKELYASGLITKKIFQDMLKKARSFQKTVTEARKKGGLVDLKQLRQTTKEIKNQRIANKAMGKSSIEAYDDIKEGVTSAGSMMSAFSSKSPLALKKSAVGAAEMANKLKISGKAWSEMGGAMKGAGTMAKMAGGALGGISKVMSGPVGMIGMAVKAVWDLGMAADTVVKDANKSFATFRGPDIMTSDVKGQFDDFNKQIYNTSANWKDGIDVDQARGFAGALYQAGKSIADLNGGFSNYRTVIHVAAKASKSLGTDIVAVGSMMGGMMTDMKANLEDTDRTFNQIAFDAKKAGLSTDRFWNTVQNASASLSMYGLITKSVSKSLKSMMESGAVGAQEVQAAQEDMFGAFKNGSLSANAALLDLAKKGGANVDKIFGKKIEELGSRKVEIEAKISEMAGMPKTDANKRQLQDLNTELANTNSKIARFSKVQHTDSVTQATEMGELASEAPSLLTDMIEGIADGTSISKISGDKLNATLESASKFGIGKNTARAMIVSAQATEESLNLAVKGIKELKSTDGIKMVDLLKSLNQSDKSSDIYKNGQAILKLQGKTDAVSLAKLDELNATQDGLLAEQTANRQVLSTKLTDMLGGDEKQANSIVALAEVNSDANEKLQQLISGTKDGKALSESQKAILKKGLEKLSRQGNIVSEVYKKGATDDLITQAQAADKSEKALENVVDQTLSYEDMKKIAGDEIKYRLAALGFAQKLNGLVANIFKGLSGASWFSAKETDTVISAKENVKKMGGWVENPFEQAKRSGKVLGENQKVVVKKTKSVAEGEKTLDSINTSIGLLEKLAKEGKPHDKKRLASLKDQKEKLKAQLDLDKKTLKEAEEQVKKQVLMINALEEIKEGSSDLAKLFAANLDPEKLGDMIAGDIDSGMSMDDLKKKWGDSVEDMAANLKSSTKGSIALEKLRDRYTNNLAGAPTEKESLIMGQTAPKKSPIQKNATLSKPMIVTSPGIVKLDPGERILPKNNNFKQIPDNNKNSTVGAGAGNSSKNITINVNATERDLAQRIANEIRSALYNEKLTGKV